jgi:hypothetical protein
VEEAKTMMIDTLRWREEFNIEAAMNEKFPDLFTGFGHLYGRDKEGRPIWYALFSLPCSFSSEPDGGRSYNVYGGSNDLQTAFSDVQRFVR